MSVATLGGRFTFPGTSLTAQRIGYGAMQLAGPGVWGPPKDPDGAVAVLREACGKPRTPANFAGFSRECRESLPACWEGDLNPRAPSDFGLLKTPRVRPIILRSFSEPLTENLFAISSTPFKPNWSPQWR
jgi:hypothetical protein